MKTLPRIVICVVIVWVLRACVVSTLGHFQSKREALSAKEAARLGSALSVYAFIPITVAILVSGNAHAPSQGGATLGDVMQWFVVGLLIFALSYVFRRSSAKSPKTKNA